MSFDDTYKTVAKQAESVFMDKGSRFIGYAIPLKDAQDVKMHLLKIKNEHPKARHYCWAYRLSTDRTIFRINDDGEPSGTAGKPILNVLLSLDVTNILIIVVRYFGGHLLGIPRLVSAYKSATAECIKNASIITEVQQEVYQITFNYSAFSTVMSFIKKKGLSILSQNFTDEYVMLISIRKKEEAHILHEFKAINELFFKWIKNL